MFKKSVIALSVILLCVLVWTELSCGVFDDFYGKKTFYTGSPSSNATITTGSSKLLFDVMGESIEIDSAVYYKTILKQFNARLIFVEDTTDGTSYYAYSPKIKYLTILNGDKINLHIHVKNGKTVIGSPIIFGSF